MKPKGLNKIAKKTKFHFQLSRPEHCFIMIDPTILITQYNRQRSSIMIWKKSMTVNTRFSAQVVLKEPTVILGNSNKTAVRLFYLIIVNDMLSFFMRVCNA